MIIEEILKTESALEILGIKNKLSQGGGVISGVRTINGEMPDGMGDIIIQQSTSSSEIDGGFANSVYLTSQLINAGGA